MCTVIRGKPVPVCYLSIPYFSLRSVGPDHTCIDRAATDVQPVMYRLRRHASVRRPGHRMIHRGWEMGSSKALWIFLEIGAIMLFPVAVGIGYLLFPEGGIRSWGIFIAIVVLHLSESSTGLKIGRKKNLSTARILLKTWLFGFTWWLPLKRGVFEK